MGSRKSDDLPTLITIPFSHFCEKARWALDRAGVDYTEARHLPPFVRKRVRNAGGTGSVPTLSFPGGVRGESKAILKWCDERTLENQRLYPADRALMARIEDYTDRLDREYAVAVRRVLFAGFLDDPAAFVRLGTRQTPFFEGLMLRLGAKKALASMAAQMDLSPAKVQEAQAEVERTLADAEAQLAEGARCLMGSDRMTAADLVFASFTAALVLPPEHPGGMGGVEDLPAKLRPLVTAVRERKAGRFVLELYSRERKKRA
jgi:glutathione S-transferase